MTCHVKNGSVLTSIPTSIPTSINRTNKNAFGGKKHCLWTRYIWAHAAPMLCKILMFCKCLLYRLMQLCWKWKNASRNINPNINKWDKKSCVLGQKHYWGQNTFGHIPLPKSCKTLMLGKFLFHRLKQQVGVVN